MHNPTSTPIEAEADFARELIEHIVENCPRRRPTSDDERRAQEILEGILRGLGIETDYHGFMHNESLYAAYVLHFGLGTLGTLVGGRHPAAGLALHLLAGGSYWSESVRRRYVLRRALPQHPSQNLLAVVPAKGERRLRVVVPAHVDAAFTGLIFHPEVIRRTTHEPLAGPLALLSRPLALVTYSQLGLAAVDLVRLLSGRRLQALRPFEWAATVPALITLLVNLEIVLRDRIVPGAVDNLSAVAAGMLLAARFAAAPREGVELVVAFTGCEEAGLGGASALARDMQDQWSPQDTLVLTLDGLSNGELRYFEEGEVVMRKVPEWIGEVLMEAAGDDPRVPGFGPFEIPAGATDMSAFRSYGYEGAALGCVDPKVGAPEHYHWITDTPDNLDYDKIVTATDVAERVIDGLARRKLG